MIQRFIHRFLKRRHFWRYASFAEVAELYASRLMTMFALKFVIAFASVYLYKLGFSVTLIALLWALYYGAKLIAVVPVSLILARIGPKHGVFMANVLFAAGLGLLLLAEEYGTPIVIAWCLVHGSAGTLNNICYRTDFSKVKHNLHAGKEIGIMNVVEKIGAGLSPLIGGAIASFFGPVWAIWLTVVIFLLAAVPLFRTGEQVKRNQTITLRGFPWRSAWRSMRAGSGLGVDVMATSTAWTLFISVVVFAGDGDELYVKIGALASISLVIAFVASYLFGNLIDRKQGLLLLRSSAIANSLLHLLRPAVSTPTGVLLTNSINEVAYTGYSLAFIRGEFDLADTPGYRIVYLSLMEIWTALGAVVAALALAGFSYLYGEIGGFSVFYVFAAFATLLIAAPRFPLYKR